MKRPDRLSQVSLLSNSLTTFRRFRLTVHCSWNFRSARELNLAGNIVDPSHVLRFQNVLSAVALVTGLRATSLMILITLGIKTKSSVGRFCICCKHKKFSFWHINFNIWYSTNSSHFYIPRIQFRLQGVGWIKIQAEVILSFQKL